jgi:phenylalanyl-tRNA synthetase beta chain
MKVSYRWLSEYVDIHAYTAEQLAELFTRSGIEVDTIDHLNKGVSQVVVGFVKSCVKHPEADKLSVCIIDVGQTNDIQIVCGAKNIAAGQKVPVALVGAQLPNGLLIQQAQLRGVASQGMICSAKELGLNEKRLPKEAQEGIFILPRDTEVGLSVLDVLAIDDQVLVLDLTPNRSDCLSMIGVAYEIAAILDLDIKLAYEDIQVSFMESARHNQIYRQGGVAAKDQFEVNITSTDACSHYAVQLIQGVQISASPLWIQNRLMAAGIRPINNIVDITNMVMIEMGQPLHAFDADQLHNRVVDVRFAHDHEKIVTLDGVERILESHMLVITDGMNPIALAGVMGGLYSEVKEHTVNVLLESAHFSSSVVRKTSRQLGLRSEASLRFEKDVNRETILVALQRAALLIAQYGGGQIVGEIVQSISTPIVATAITLFLDKVNTYLGTSMTQEQIVQIFDRLKFTHEAIDTAGFLIHIPKRRGDITRDVDIIEEVARLYGYDRIPTTLMSGVTTPGALSKAQQVLRITRNAMTQSGLHEAMTYSLTEHTSSAFAQGLYPSAIPISLAMPMSEERSVLRTSLLPHLLEVIRYNRNRNMHDVALFEMGKVFVTHESVLTRLPDEKLLLAIVMTGNRCPTNWSQKSEPVDFYDVKGILDSWLHYLGITGVSLHAAQYDDFHPGRTANIHLEMPDAQEGDAKHQLIGRMGQLHPTLQQKLDLQDTYVLEVECDPLIAATSSAIAYKLLPRFPAIVRDLAIVVDRAVPVAAIEQEIKRVATDYLESIHLFDIFQGEQIGLTRKSVAYSLLFRHPERTLQDDEVSRIHQGIVTSLHEKFQAELRK